MSDDVMPYAGMPLHGGKVSIGSPSPASAERFVRAAGAAGRDFIGPAMSSVAQAATALWPAVSFWGVVALWAAPALVLSRYPRDQLLDALVSVSLKPTGRGILMLFLVLTYIVLTGLMVGAVTGFPRRKWVRMLLRVAAAPLVALSLIATLLAAAPLFFGALIMCFPGLV